MSTKGYTVCAKDIKSSDGSINIDKDKGTYNLTTPGSGGATDHGLLGGLTDDDHTQYLLTDGTRAMGDDLDMDDNNITNVGSIYGAGVSMYAGIVKMAQFNNSTISIYGDIDMNTNDLINVGTIGTNTIVNIGEANTTDGGAYTIAIGSSVTSTGSQAISIGKQANGAGLNTIAIGPSAGTLNARDIAIGAASQATGGNSTALGATSSAGGASSICIGYNSTASGSTAVAVGSISTSSGPGAVSLGYSCTASADDSVAIGNGAQATSTFDTIAIGRSAIASASSAIQLGNGTNTLGNSLQIYDWMTLAPSYLQSYNDNAIYMELFSGAGTNKDSLNLHVNSSFNDNLTKNNNITLAINSTINTTASDNNIFVVNGGNVTGTYNNTLYSNVSSLTLPNITGAGQNKLLVSDANNVFTAKNNIAYINAYSYRAGGTDVSVPVGNLNGYYVFDSTGTVTLPNASDIISTYNLGIGDSFAFSLHNRSGATRTIIYGTDTGFLRSDGTIDNTFLNTIPDAILRSYYIIRFNSTEVAYLVSAAVSLGSS